jgi:hypothetical protein
MQIIPFREPGAWEEQVTLDNVIFNLIFKWNAINQYWVMNIYDLNQSPILLGVKIVTNFNLTKQFAAITGMPVGDILCQNTLGLFFEITRFSMGEQEQLYYYEPGELKSIVADYLNGLSK